MPKKKPVKRSKAFEAGLAMRKKVLGPDYVEKSLANADEFSWPFQQFATEFAWGSVWTRPELSPRDRSLVTLAQCIALNRPNELRIHLRGALRNGVTKTEIREVCLHSFLYCGGPASLDAFHTIKAALPEIEALERALKAKKQRAKGAARDS
ncbi:MAG: carboxymuconolactone decarboxylase family protein [Rhodospirillaceae bacterium]